MEHEDFFTGPPDKDDQELCIICSQPFETDETIFSLLVKEVGKNRLERSWEVDSEDLMSMRLEDPFLDDALCDVSSKAKAAITTHIDVTYTIQLTPVCEECCVDAQHSPHDPPLAKALAAYYTQTE